MLTKQTWAAWLILAALWFASLPWRPMFDPDEGRYAEIPREMAATGDWVTPRLDGLKYFEKPPLQYWATASLYSVFGVHEWAARAWAVGLAFACVPLVYGFTRRLGYRAEESTVAAALLAINPYFALTGQVNLLDQGFCFFLCGAVFGFALAQRAAAGSASERNYMLLTWAALALAVLSKGIVTLVLAGGTVFFYMVIRRDASPLRRMHFLLGLPLFLVVTLPWFWLVQSRNPEFAQFFFIHEHFARFLTNVHNRIEPWWYFLKVLLIALLPVLWNLRRVRWIAPADAAAPAFRVDLYLVIWAALVFVLFSASHSKLASYVLPMMPALAVLLAPGIAAQPSAFRRAETTMLLLLVIVGVGLVFQGRQRTGALHGANIAWAAAVVVIAGVAAALTRRKDFDRPRQWFVLAAATAAGFQCLFMSYAVALPYRSTSTLVSQVSGGLRADDPLYSVGEYRHSLSFYLQRELAIYDFSGELEFGLRQAGVEPGTNDRAKFLRDWSAQSRGLAFIDVRSYPALEAAGLPGRVVARDARSIVVSRS